MQVVRGGVQSGDTAGVPAAASFQVAPLGAQVSLAPAPTSKVHPDLLINDMLARALRWPWLSGLLVPLFC